MLRNCWWTGWKKIVLGEANVTILLVCVCFDCCARCSCVLLLKLSPAPPVVSGAWWECACVSYCVYLSGLKCLWCMCWVKSTLFRDVYYCLKLRLSSTWPVSVLDLAHYELEMSDLFVYWLHQALWLLLIRLKLSDSNKKGKYKKFNKDKKKNIQQQAFE